MRISDWSSDVCSSDLLFQVGVTHIHHVPGAIIFEVDPVGRDAGPAQRIFGAEERRREIIIAGGDEDAQPARSEERRVGKGVSVRVDLGGRRIIKKKKKQTRYTSYIITTIKYKQ